MRNGFRGTIVCGYEEITLFLRCHEIICVCVCVCVRVHSRARVIYVHDVCVSRRAPLTQLRISVLHVSINWSS